MDTIKTRSIGIFKMVSVPVFFISVSIILGAVAYFSFESQAATSLFSYVLEEVSRKFGWLYVLAVNIFLGVLLYLAFSPFGRIKLGDQNEEPKYGYFAWFAMLFSAGTGTGLLFWSIAEPITHYVNPPFGPGETVAAAENALKLAYFHWGIHGWAIFATTGLAIAYFAFRRKLPLAVRSAFYPLLGDRIYGPIGHLIDILAVLGTMFGVATSLGLGVMQLNAGLNYLLGIDQVPLNQVLLIAGITAMATISVVLGLDRGIKRLSTIALCIGIGLLAFVFLIGPTVFIIKSLLETTGFYLRDFIELGLWTDAMRNSDWQTAWTAFYWGWWIAWSPFVGIFIARISRGRTIREFVLCVLLLPSAGTFAWISAFGGTAISFELNDVGNIAQAVSSDVSTALFVTLDQLPWEWLTASLGMIAVIAYFVTSSDSASLVIDMLTAGGRTNPPTIQRIFWAVMEGLTAATLLVAGGKAALDGLQAMAITSGLPFCIIMLFMCWSLVKSVRAEPIPMVVHHPDQELARSSESERAAE